MDGLETLQNMIVIAATNRPDIIDPAMLRPGRFDRLIYVPPPNEESRQEIFKIHTKEMPLADDVDVQTLARETKGYTGADIVALCREAGMLVLRQRNDLAHVSIADFKQAMDVIGPTITSEMEKWYQNVTTNFRKPLQVVTNVA